MKKIQIALLCAFMSLSLFACGKGSSSEEKKEDAKQIDKYDSKAEQLKNEDPQLYDIATKVMTQIKMDFDFGLEDVTNLKVNVEFPYIELYYISSSTKEAVTSFTYSKQDASTIGLDARVVYDPTTKKINSVTITTTDPTATEEAIIFCLAHLDGITNSTDINETLALKEVLAKNDEDTMSYTVAKKWKTLKMIDESITTYKVSIIE